MATFTIFEGSNYAKISNPLPAKSGGGMRSNITTFSSGSRKRLLDTAQQINRQKILQNPLFVTLTYPSIFPHNHRVCKRHLDTLSKRLDRIFRNYFVIWRLEYQVEGGTRRGAPHYHLLFFFRDSHSRVRNIKRFRQWLALAWYQIVDSKDIKHFHAGTQADFIRNWRGVIYYTGKYIAKVNQTGVPDIMEDHPGRFWGIFGRSNMPIDETYFEIPDDMFYNIRRIFRKVYEAHVKQKYRFRNNTLGMSIYLDSATCYDILQFIAQGFKKCNITERKLP
jgi:hypothetical protein